MIDSDLRFSALERYWPQLSFLYFKACRRRGPYPDYFPFFSAAADGGFRLAAAAAAGASVDGTAGQGIWGLSKVGYGDNKCGS